MKKERLHKITASIITLSILSILIMSGPAQAFILGLTIFDNEVEKGELISFTASIKIENGEYLDIKNIVLELKGIEIPISFECSFNVKGEIIKGCEGIKIEQMSSTQYDYGYGYGYGYTNGNLVYNITLNTSYYIAGTYETYLNIFVKEKSFFQQGENISIKTKVMPLEGYSLRAKGKLIVEGKDFGEGKLNFYVPLKNAANGKGSLTGQKDRNRASYEFDVQEIVENNNSYAIVLISGSYRIALENEKKENALIFLDKINKKISLVGDNIELSDAEISFSKG